MRVKNGKAIRKLSLRSYRAAGKRNLIAVLAIVLTTVLFTSLFTIVMSLNESYQTYTFRGIGSYAHGSFKDVNEEEIREIRGHKKIRATGERTVAGTITDGVFAKEPAEISFMDSNATKWSYIELEEGHEPKKENEVIMDRAALELLGITPEVGAKISLTYQVSDKKQSGGTRTDHFVLAGWWEFDPVAPVHFINVSEKYIENLEEEMVKKGLQPFRTDLSVMLSVSLKPDATMKQIEQDLGYQRSDPNQDNYVDYGVNWGYTSAQTEAKMDPGTLAAMAAFLILVIFTGYLIIYNIFQISVTSDIRYYGLLKTIGVTPRQLKRIIRRQAMLLCAIGCPLGLAAGWLVGYLLVPVVIESTSRGEMRVQISASPLIFVAAALFSVATVLISCSRPGKMAAKVSPIEAVKYTEAAIHSRKQRRAKHTGIHRMALANLGRSKKKTILVLVSLSLSVVLLAVTLQFTGGFSMEKYLQKQTCADFVVGNTDYFRFSASSPESEIAEETVKMIQENTEEKNGGQAWGTSAGNPVVWLDKQQFQKMSYGASAEEIRDTIQYREKRGDLIQTTLQVEGMDEALLNKLTVIKGDLKALQDPQKQAIAIAVNTDDYGNADPPEDYPQVGEKLPVTYVDEACYVDSRTGQPVTDTTPEEYYQYHVEKSHDVEYTVCALVTVPDQISFRYSMMYGMEAVMGTEQLREDSGQELYPLFYMFDTPDREAEKEAEDYLAGLTAGASSEITYESKEILRKEFQGFQRMFLILGGALCAIVGIVGILNFFNATMTGILTRKRELAMLQAVGMTGKQLKKMLIIEGILYAGITVLISVILILIIEPRLGRMLESMFWFFEYHFTITAVWITAPVFFVMGVLLPLAVYRMIGKRTIVERLRDAE